jgi:quercetin dioxygenase-like cupin family protein
MKRLRYRFPLAVVAVLALGAGVGVVAATQPARPVATTIAAGSLETPAHSVIVVQDEHETKASVAEVGQVRTLRITLAPGGAFPWHRHPGPVWVIVTRGTLTYYDAACAPHQYPAGSVFFDRGTVTHTARNEGAEPLEVMATILLPADAGEAVTIPFPAPPSCPIEV